MRRLLAVLLLPLLSLAAAHADLVSSEPAAGAVTVAPERVVLHYSEPLETLFSVFKVYRLDAEVDLTAADAGPRLNGLAAALVSEVLDLRDDEGDARVDTGIESEGATVTELAILLQEDLPAGHYVAMWRVLSIDTHVTQGFIVFTVSAE